MSRIATIVITVSILLIASLTWAVDHYRDNAAEYKKQQDEKTQALALANAIITDLQARQRDIYEIDAKYTKELADAKQTIDALRDAIAAGDKQLRVKASCKPVHTTTRTTSVDDAIGPRLTDAAERDYFRLREGIETLTSQLKGLQVYVKDQCVR